MFNLINKKNQKPSNHILRFCETKFKQLKPTIHPGGSRYYSKKNIEVVKMIVFLLKQQGLSVNGAVKIMNDNAKKLDDLKAMSIKELYFRKNIKAKSKNILRRIKKLNG